jgi:predicted amidohydrolase YtcJ
VLNTLALKHTGLAELRADPPGGALGRTRHGEPDGRVFERCFGAAEAVAREALVARDRDGWFENANLYQDRLLAAGITHVCDAAVPPSMEELYRQWQQRGDLRLGVTMMPLVENMFAVPTQRFDGPASGWSDGRLSLGPLKLFTDGGIACAVCITLREAILQFATSLGRMLATGSLQPLRLARQQAAHLGVDRRLHLGLLYYRPDELREIVRRACEHGFSVGIHAGGNEAIEMAVDALASTYRGDLPPRIEHYFFLDEAVLRRAASAGIHAVVQPAQLYETGDLLRASGLPKRLTYQAFRQMLDAGLVLAGSSDAPVVGYDVLAAIDVAVRRRLRSGRVLGREQALSVAQALHMYTRGAAATLGLEGEIGCLRPAARADAVVLSDDPTAVPLERLPEIRVAATFAGRYAVCP